MKIIIKFLKMFRKRNDGTKHPIQSMTVWGLFMSVIAPLLTQLIGVDVLTIFELIKNFNITDGKHSVKEWLEIFGQITGYFLMIIGSFSKNRKPLSIEDNSFIEE